MKRPGCSSVFSMMLIVVLAAIAFRLYFPNGISFGQGKTGSILPRPLPPLQPGQMPPVTHSWYETVEPTDYQKMYDQGCTEAKSVPGGLLALLWGEVDTHNGVYGKYDWAAHQRFVTDDQIAVLVEHYVDGMKDCWRPENYSFAVAIGTSNYGSCFCPNPDAAVEQDSGWYKAGQSWGQTVNTIQQYVIDQGMTGKLVIHGSFDAEAAWGPPAHSIALVDGYSSVTSQLLFNNGDDEWVVADVPGSDTYATATRWTRQNLWYISYGNPNALPAPEIYYPIMAEEWEDLSVWGCTHAGGPLRIVISWTQTNVNYLPRQAWDKLSAEIASNECTKPMLSSLMFASNIDWYPQ